MLCIRVSGQRPNVKAKMVSRTDALMTHIGAILVVCFWIGIFVLIAGSQKCEEVNIECPYMLAGTVMTAGPVVLVYIIVFISDMISPPESFNLPC